MKILSLKIEDGFFCKEYNFSNRCLIYSKENSKGKTTLIRMILFAMGYNIPSTKKVNFNKYTFTLKLMTDKEFELKRVKTKILVKNDEHNETFILPTQENELHSLIFGIQNKDVIKNLLGCFYLDQEKGWTLLNDGTVIGRIHFDIKELIRGTSNIDCNNIINDLRNIQNQIQKYTTMLEVAKYKKSLRTVDATFDKNISLSENIESSLNDLYYKQRQIKQKLKLYSEIIKNNNEFIEQIEKAHLMFQLNNNEYLITKDNIKNYNDISEMTKAKLSLLQIELNKIEIEISRLKLEKEKNFSLVSMESILDTFNTNVSKISIDENAVSNTISYLKQRKKELEDLLKSKTKSSNNIQKLYNYISQYANELDFNDYIEKENIFIFTSDLKSLSGAVLHKLVFIFKMSYIKLIYEIFGIKLPIILDSPKGKEVDRANIKKIMKLIKDHFDGFQVIIASIDNDYDIGIESPIIELKNGVLED